MPRVQTGSTETWQLTTPLATLWRTGATLQLGLEPPAGLLVTDAEPGMVQVLDALAAPRTRHELEQTAGPGHESWLDALLHLLLGAGLLRATRVHAGAVSVIGRGRLATLLVELLLAQLDGPVRLVWPGAGGMPREVGALAARFAARLQFADHWPYESTTSGLTLVVTRAAEAERSLLAQLGANGQPYLVVRACDLGATVGPLVVPGRTPCQRCEDLHRCARDPAWPRLLAQLCRQRPEATALNLHWAVTTAALQAVAWLEGALPDTLGAGLELSTDRQLHLRPLRAHPGCGCLDFS